MLGYQSIRFAMNSIIYKNLQTNLHVYFNNVKFLAIYNTGWSKKSL